MVKGLSIIIFAYNEEKFILTTCQRLLTVLRTIKLNHEIIVLNDASTDNTKKIFNSKFKNSKKIKMITLKKNTGLSGLIKESLRHVRYDKVTYFPGDDSFLSKGLNTFFQKGLYYDLVLGVRSNTTIFSTKRKILSKVNNMFINFLCPYNLKDVHGLQIHSTKLLKNVSFFGIRYACWVEIIPSIFKLQKNLKFCETKVYVNPKTLFKSNTLSSSTISNFALVWFKMFLKKYLNFKF